MGGWARNRAVIRTEKPGIAGLAPLTRRLNFSKNKQNLFFDIFIGFLMQAPLITSTAIDSPLLNCGRKPVFYSTAGFTLLTRWSQFSENKRNLFTTFLSVFNVGPHLSPSLLQKSSLSDCGRKNRFYSAAVNKRNTHWLQCGTNLYQYRRLTW